MDINNITIWMNQATLLRSSTTPNKIDSAASNLTVSNESQGLVRNPMAQILSINSDIDYIKNQLESLLNDYPPFFPPGSPQRVDVIKGIKGIQEKIEKAQISSNINQTLTGPRITDQATDNEIVAALNALTSFRDSSLQNAAGAKEAGTVLNLKI